MKTRNAFRIYRYIVILVIEVKQIIHHKENKCELNFFQIANFSWLYKNHYARIIIAIATGNNSAHPYTYLCKNKYLTKEFTTTTTTIVYLRERSSPVEKMISKKLAQFLL